jgi:PAS domain S-box-containing protein
LFDQHQQPKRMIGVMWDITWQKQAEVELIRYSERLDTVIESITDAFFIIDREWRFIRANQTFTRLNNTTEEKIIGRNIWEAFPSLKGSDLQKVYQKAMEENKSVSLEISDSAARSWYYVSVYPSKEGLAVYARDITREKEIRQQVAFSQKNLDTLINNTADLIWSLDKDMRIISANDAYKALLAILVGRTEIKSGDPAITGAYEAQPTQRFEDYYRRALSGERFMVEESIEIPEKGPFYVEVTFNPMYNEEGQVIGIGCFARDITERKKSEEEKSHLIQNLFAQNKYLEEFAFVTSHNLRAPVARILGLTGIFNRKSITDPYNIKLLDNLAKSAQLLDEVIRDLALILDIRKQEEEMREEVHFENILFEVEELLAQEIEKTGAEIRADFTKAPKIFTLKSYLRNIVLNLVSNAIKYKKLNQPPQIFVESYKKSTYVCISVKDKGLGVDMDKYGNQIFTLYKRFHYHTEGKGMGMYLIKSQVDALDGKIRIESKVNEGTTVEIFLKNESPKKKA